MFPKLTQNLKDYVNNVKNVTSSTPANVGRVVLGAATGSPKVMGTGIAGLLQKKKPTQNISTGPVQGPQKPIGPMQPNNPNASNGIIEFTPKDNGVIEFQPTSFENPINQNISSADIAETVNKIRRAVYSDPKYDTMAGGTMPAYSSEVAFQDLNNAGDDTSKLYAIADMVNNRRNDIATGTTDPFGINKIPLTSAQYKSARDAMSGAYDPLVSELKGRVNYAQDMDKINATNTAKSLESGLFNASGIGTDGNNKYMSIMSNADIPANQKTYINTMLNTNPTEAMNQINKIYTQTAYRNLKGDAKMAYDVAGDVASKMPSVIAAFENLTGPNSPYRNMAQKATVFFGGAQNQDYQNLSAAIAGLAAPIRKDYFGASLTDGEKAAANEFLPDMTRDTMDTIMTKTIGLKMYYDNIQKRKIAQYYGEPAPTMKYTTTDILKMRKQFPQTTPSQIFDIMTEDDQSFNKVGSGTNKAPKVVAGYDISSYATDPNHEVKVANIYQKLPTFKKVTDIDNAIRQMAPKSRITGQMIATAANTYGVDPKMVYAIMMQDSSLGTAGMGAKNNNPGNIAQYDHLNRPVAGYATLQDGVSAVANWLSKKKVQPNTRKYA